MNSLQSSSDETSATNRRRSRWDPPSEDTKNDTSVKKRKSRWDNGSPKPVTHLPKGNIIEFDPELLSLKSRLIAINTKLKSSQILDSRPINARSPSPEPVYDNLGIRINTREFRARVKLNIERQDVISQIVKISPEFKPPGGDCKKHLKKIFVPVKEYPGYNFIGLIIGPRGNTQKRMEKETGARISLRGKGSSKKDSLDNEELHVLVEAESWESVQAAAVMVEALLKPVDDLFNLHKREQLKELAELNGTLDNGVFRLGVKSEVSCEICGDFKHSTSFCPLKKKPDKKVDEVYKNFLEEMGGSTSESWWLGGPETPSTNVSRAGSGSSAVPKGYDETKLYVGYLPVSVDDDGLIRLFLSFGEIVFSKVIKDIATGVSKGYGFVKFADVQQANSAIAAMNGYVLDGRNLAVRVAGKPPQPTLAPLPNVLVFPPGPVQPGGAFVYRPTPQFGSQYPPQPTLAPLPNVPVLPPGPAQPGVTFPPVPQFGAQYPPQPTITLVPNAVLPTSTCPAQPGDTLTYSPVSQYGVQYPPPLVPPSTFLPESVTSTDNRYDFASFDEKPSYSSRHSESSTSIPVYTTGNSATSKSASPYTYVLSNGTVLPPFTCQGLVLALPEVPVMVFGTQVY